MNFEGYPIEVDYGFNYSRSLSPSFLRLVTLSRFVPFPTRRPLRYLELGYGNGVSLNIHAAANPGDFWGTDVNSSHAEFAGMLAKISGAGVRALNLSFADLLDQPELPDFDVIIANGVWSWISEANREIILKFLDKKLVKGGLFYLTYNALPGCATIIPLQQLLHLASQKDTQELPILQRLEAGISLARNLRDAGSDYFTRAPLASERLEELETDDPIHLCHEYLTDHWKPSSFAETALTLTNVGLTYVGSANLMDHYDELNFDPKGVALLASIEEPWIRETARDFLKDQQFRRDLYVKSNVVLTNAERDEAFRHIAFTRLVPDKETPAVAPATRGSVNLDKPPFNCILASLAEDGYRWKTMRELSDRCLKEDNETSEIIRALMILVQLDIVHPVQDQTLIERADQSCRKLNKAIISGRGGEKLRVLASPLTGGGIYTSRTHLLFLQALRSGEKTPDRWAKVAWEALSKETVSENAQNSQLQGATLLRQAVLFQKFLPILSCLGV
jgi:hypothetical protein